MAMYIIHCGHCRRSFPTGPGSISPAFCSTICRTGYQQEQNKRAKATLEARIVPTPPPPMMEKPTLPISSSTPLKFDVEGLLNKLGPRARVAKFCGVARTAPYGWIRRGYIGSSTMAKLVIYARLQGLDLDLNKFFKPLKKSEAA